MTSRCAKDVLRQNTFQSRFLDRFLQYLGKWEMAAKDGGFLSQSTAEGLRVTISTALGLLKYLATLGFGYLMTARISQDPLERLFGVVRQFSGPNDHPTPSQFLITVNCLSFYNLARSPAGANVSQGVLSALLECQDARPSLTSLVDNYIECGQLEKAEEVLSQDHNTHIKSSDSRLVYYVAGYTARKCVLPLNCEECTSICTTPSAAQSADHPSSYMKEFNRGGLLNCSETLFRLVSKLEDVFTRLFSCHKVHADSLLEVMACARGSLENVGCQTHSEYLTMSIVKFYAVTRMHFLVKGINRSRAERSKKQKLSKEARLQ
ncbi:uncharacterized protein LOC135387298 [Ornithodoros turicata]|uniref:uncharacterized protein LOC135387298 n=1 Tax=Ornithodoros turicata TaxID=34597 RepID=UPI00313A4856